MCLRQAATACLACSQGQRQRLFAEDVFAGLGGHLDLPGVAVDRRGDVDGLDLRVGQQVGLAAYARGTLELGGDRARRIDRVHHRHQPAVLGLEHAGNRLAHGRCRRRRSRRKLTLLALASHEPCSLPSAEYALITFTSRAAICRMSSSVNVGKAKQVKVCDSCQRALGTSTLL